MYRRTLSLGKETQEGGKRTQHKQGRATTTHGSVQLEAVKKGKAEIADCGELGGKNQFRCGLVITWHRVNIGRGNRTKGKGE